MSYLITEDRLARLRRALQASTDGVLIADGAGRIRFVSEAFSRFFRRPHVHLADMEDLPRLFHDPVAAREHGARGDGRGAQLARRAAARCRRRHASFRWRSAPT